MRVDIASILFEEIEKTRLQIIANMQANNQVVTARTANSLHTEATENSGILWGAEHISTLETGISPFQSRQMPYDFLKQKMDSWLLFKHGTQIYRNIAPPNVKDAYQNQRQFGSTLFRQTGGNPTGLVYGKEVNPLVSNIGKRISDVIINTKILE